MSCHVILQTVGVTVRTLRHRFDDDEFSILSGG